MEDLLKRLRRERRIALVHLAVFLAIAIAVYVVGTALAGRSASSPVPTPPAITGLSR